MSSISRGTRFVLIDMNIQINATEVARLANIKKIKKTKVCLPITKCDQCLEQYFIAHKGKPLENVNHNVYSSVGAFPSVRRNSERSLMRLNLGGMSLT